MKRIWPLKATDARKPYNIGANAKKREARAKKAALASFYNKRQDPTRNYEESIYATCKAMARKWPDPDRLTSAHRKLVTKLFSYASFASFGPEV